MPSIASRAALAPYAASPYSSPSFGTTSSHTAPSSLHSNKALPAAKKKEEKIVSEVIVNYEAIKTKAQAERKTITKQLEAVIIECMRRVE
jgi:hypothetical protein